MLRLVRDSQLHKTSHFITLHNTVCYFFQINILARKCLWRLESSRCGSRWYLHSDMGSGQSSRWSFYISNCPQERSNSRMSQHIYNCDFEWIGAMREDRWWHHSQPPTICIALKMRIGWNPFSEQQRSCIPILSFCNKLTDSWLHILPKYQSISYFLLPYNTFHTTAVRHWQNCFQDLNSLTSNNQMFAILGIAK